LETNRENATGTPWNVSKSTQKDTIPVLVSDMQQINHQNYDLVFKEAFSLFENRSLDFLGLVLPRKRTKLRWNEGKRSMSSN